MSVVFLVFFQFFCVFFFWFGVFSFWGFFIYAFFWVGFGDHSCSVPPGLVSISVVKPVVVLVFCTMDFVYGNSILLPNPLIYS